MVAVVVVVVVVVALPVKPSSRILVSYMPPRPTNIDIDPRARFRAHCKKEDQNHLSSGFDDNTHHPQQRGHYYYSEVYHSDVIDKGNYNNHCWGPLNHHWYGKAVIGNEIVGV